MNYIWVRTKSNGTDPSDPTEGSADPFQIP